MKHNFKPGDKVSVWNEYQQRYFTGVVKPSYPPHASFPTSVLVEFYWRPRDMAQPPAKRMFVFCGNIQDYHYLKGI